ncbi:hydantoinase B/oxoprolinase family protein [Roseovarius spongiae]|uniref:Hydantoinase B/oxoprolinase family protein n=1 Tax=Roseovarius spongiae TaxID=2320272 RepID=A0A3A8AQM1_9RHOB|nr:hydantoinase B/oxoprolinase family protein [Roseovarius spongiae]RKF12672.1 hydantoinase B/oxoprolinase family protein [Roseovarius spongiae]
MTLSDVDHAILNRALIAASHEMGAKLIRSAHSPIVREAQDCSAALTDPQGRVVAQAELTAIQLGSISHTLETCLSRFPADTLTPDDFLINNDPFNGGQHVQDIFLFTPIFHEGQLIGFSASVVHHIDVGGGAPGLNAEARDVFQEGLIFPPTKYSFKRDWNGGPFERMIAANVRLPESTIGDLNAQFAANLIGAKRLTALAEQYGVDKLFAAMAGALDYSERRMRNAIVDLRDGAYTAEAEIEGATADMPTTTIRTQIRISGDQMEITFDGTDEQLKNNLNCPYASTIAAAIACVKSVLTSDDVPFNDGIARAVKVSSPLGSVLNPRPPAAVRARLLASHRVFNSIMIALSEVCPDQVIAEGFDTTTPICLSHQGASGYNIYLEILGGGYGAGAQNDGADGVDCPLSNCANIPIEALEMDYPFMRIENYSLRPGSGGKGRLRGGHGFERSYRMLEDGVLFSTYTDRFNIQPRGLAGGEPGATCSIHVESDGKEIALTSRASRSLKKDDLLVVRTGGGAGYGDPTDRPERLKEADRRLGLA